jgi:hypothetical protein
MATSLSAATLQQLADIIEPAAPPWWPPAVGWQLLGALALLIALALSIRAVRRYRRSAYRRAALAELAALPAPADAACITPLLTLLRRVALIAYPRHQIAPLQGDAWLAFLEHTGQLPIPAGCHALLLCAAYQSPRQLERTAANDIAALSRFVANWIRHHRCGVVDV